MFIPAVYQPSSYADGVDLVRIEDAALDGPMPLTILCGVYVSHLFTVAMLNCGSWVPQPPLLSGSA